jgi:hypothetical protein
MSVSAVRSLVAAAGVTLALGICAWPAGATVIHEGTDSGTDHFTDDSCGFTLVVDVTFQTRSLLRVDQTGQAFLEHTIFRVTETVTNPATGGYFYIVHRGLYHEIKATQVEGTVYEFVAVEAGQPFVIKDAAGNVVSRDRGVIRHTFLFDTLGDSQPGGDFIVELSDDVHGPHPAFAPDFPFCEIAAQLTGA